MIYKYSMTMIWTIIWESIPKRISNKNQAGKGNWINPKSATQKREKEKTY